MSVGEWEQRNFTQQRLPPSDAPHTVLLTQLVW